MPMTFLSQRELAAFRAELPRRASESWLTIRYFQDSTRWTAFGNLADPEPGDEIVIGRAGEQPRAHLEIDAHIAGSSTAGVPARLLVLRVVGQRTSHTGQTLSFLSMTSVRGKWRVWERDPAPSRTWRLVRSSSPDGRNTHSHSGYPGTDIMITRHRGTREEGYEEGGFPILWVSVGALRWLEVTPAHPEQLPRLARTEDEYEDSPLKSVRRAFLPSGQWTDKGSEARPLDSTADALVIAAYCQSTGQLHLWREAYEKHYRDYGRRNDPRAHIQAQAISDLLAMVCSRLVGDRSQSPSTLLESVVPNLTSYLGPKRTWDGGQRGIEAIAGLLRQAGVLNPHALAPVKDRLLDLGISL